MHGARRQGSVTPKASTLPPTCTHPETCTAASQAPPARIPVLGAQCFLLTEHCPGDFARGYSGSCPCPLISGLRSLSEMQSLEAAMSIQNQVLLDTVDSCSFYRAPLPLPLPWQETEAQREAGMG